MVFNATFNNISVISWWSVLLVEETGVPGENHQPVASHRQTLSHNIVSSTPCLNGIRIHNISGDRHGLCRQLFIQLRYNHDQDDPDSESISLCSFSLTWHASRRNNKYQFFNLRFYSTVPRTHDLSHFGQLYQQCDSFMMNDCFSLVLNG